MIRIRKCIARFQFSNDILESAYYFDKNGKTIQFFGKKKQTAVTWTIFPAGRNQSQVTEHLTKMEINGTGDQLLFFRKNQGASLNI